MHGTARQWKRKEKTTMRVFVTGATGFIGSAVVSELINAKHKVLGMTRSDAGAKALTAAGAEVHRGDLEDVESLRRGAGQADGVIHLAFDHNFFNFAANCEKDRRAIAALGAGLARSNSPLVITSGTAMGNVIPGKPATEDDFDANHPNPRSESEAAGAALSAAGINVSVVRLPQVHNPLKAGLVTPLIEIARKKRVSAYIGDGSNRWAAAHVLDVAPLYRMVLERQEAGSRYHAVAEEGVAARTIAEVIGQGLQVPVVAISADEAATHFGWLGMFAGLDLSASSAQTRERLGWHPTGPGLIADLAQMQWVNA
jgi:nucleoside-diphosphate-sugar epimerase